MSTTLLLSDLCRFQHGQWHVLPGWGSHLKKIFDTKNSCVYRIRLVMIGMVTNLTVFSLFGCYTFVVITEVDMELLRPTTDTAFEF